MADVELVLKVDNLNAIAAIKETELAMAQLKQTAEGGGDEQIELLKKQISVLDSFKKKTKEAEVTQEEYNEVVDETAEKSEKAGTAVGGMGKKFGALAIVTTLVITSLRALATAFKETTLGMNTANVAGAMFKQMMYDIVTLNWKAVNSTQKAIDLAKEQNALRRQQIADIKSLADYQVLYDKYMTMANNNSKTAKDRQTALTEATKLYNTIMDKKVANAAKELDQAKQLLLNQPQNAKAQEKAANAYKNFVFLQQEQILNNDKLAEQAEGINKDQLTKYLKEIEAANDAYDKRLDNQKKFQDMALKLIDEYIQAEIEALSGPARLKAERDYALKALNAFRTEMMGLGKLTPEMEQQIQGLGDNFWKKFWSGVEEAAKMGDEDTARFVELVLQKMDFVKVDLSNKLQSFKGTTATSKSSIWEMIGLSPDSESGQDTINAIKNSAYNIVNEISRSLDQLYAKRVQDADRNRTLIEDQLAFAQDRLDQEIELAKIGYANNVDLKKQEVDALNEQRKRALREQQKAVQKQQEMEALSQAISLTTSAAGIISSAIKEFGIYGLIVAALEIAGLWVAWDSYKDQAKASTRLAQGGSGDSTGMIKGKSHAAGGEHFLDHIEVEGGEKWGVLSKRASGKYGEMFDYMVDSFNKDQVPDIFPQTNIVTVDNNGSNSRLDQVISEQKKLNDQWSKEQHIILQGGRKIITRGNKTRIIG